MYEKVIDIEARTLMEIVNTQVLPDACEYQNDIAGGMEILNDVVASGKINLISGVLDDRKEMLESLSADIYYVRKNVREMGLMLEKAEHMDVEKRTAFFFSDLKPHMAHVRKHVDALEKVMPDSSWQLPKYREMLFIA